MKVQSLLLKTATKIEKKYRHFDYEKLEQFIKNSDI